MIEGILWIVQTWTPAFVDNLPSPQLFLDLRQQMILFLFNIAKAHSPSHRFLVMPRPWNLLLLWIAEQIPANQLRGLPRSERIGGSLGGQLKVSLHVTRFKPCLAGFDIGSKWKVMVLVVIFGFVEGLTLLCVFLQQLALQTCQIVHQYIYYNPKPFNPNLQHPTPTLFSLPFKPTPKKLFPLLPINKYQLIQFVISNR